MERWCIINTTQPDQRPENDGNSVERDQNLMAPGEVYNEFAHRIWAQSNKRFVCKRAENKGQEMTEIVWGVPKSDQAWELAQ